MRQIETFDKIIAIVAVCVALKIFYSISSKLFFSGMKITNIVKKIIEKVKKKNKFKIEDRE